MQPNYHIDFSVAYETDMDRGISPEAGLWTAVILQAIDDLDRHTSLNASWAENSARE
jgi:hypothetical protein